MGGGSEGKDGWTKELIIIIIGGGGDRFLTQNYSNFCNPCSFSLLPGS